MKTITFPLKPQAPFRLDLTVWALRRWPNNLMDRWDGETYRRVLWVTDIPVAVAVKQVGPVDNPRLQVTVKGDEIATATQQALRRILTHVLGTDRDLTGFYRLAASDPQLGRLADRFYGLKPPRFPTLFECLVNAVTCQQITLNLGIRMLNRLSEALGPSKKGEGEAIVGFPRPRDLMEAPGETLRKLRFSRQKARALKELSEGIVRGTLDLESLKTADQETVRARLRQLWGVRRRTTEYTLLRGLGRLDVFPADDVGARNGLERWLDVVENLDYDGVRKILADWHPYAGLVYFHLLLNRHVSDGRIEK